MINDETELGCKLLTLTNAILKKSFCKYLGVYRSPREKLLSRRINYPYRNKDYPYGRQHLREQAITNTLRKSSPQHPHELACFS